MLVGVERGLRGGLGADGGGGARVVGEGARDSLLLTAAQFLAIETEGGGVDEIGQRLY